LLYDRVIDVWITPLRPDSSRLEDIFGSISAPICLSMSTNFAEFGEASLMHIVCMREVMSAKGFQVLTEMLS
jgi:hypothetical protein